jgi:hypothetical protein
MKRTGSLIESASLELILTYSGVNTYFLSMLTPREAAILACVSKIITTHDYFKKKLKAVKVTYLGSPYKVSILYFPRFNN